MFSQPTVAALNHLLTQSGWALPRLARFGGKTARFNISPFSFSFTVENQGTLCVAAAGVCADASFDIPPSLLPRLALQDEAALKQIESSGDAALIEEIFFLVRNLRWDAAEDLSRVTGDIAAERIVHFVKAKHRLVRDTTLNLTQALAEYWTEERPLLAQPRQLAIFAQEVGKLSKDTERLQQRVRQLSEAK
jgi:ubiquinone biosynthesis protein UbiJ